MNEQDVIYHRRFIFDFSIPHKPDGPIVSLRFASQGKIGTGSNNPEAVADVFERSVLKMRTEYLERNFPHAAVELFQIMWELEAPPRSDRRAQMIKKFSFRPVKSLRKRVEADKTRVRRSTPAFFEEAREYAIEVNKAIKKFKARNGRGLKTRVAEHLHGDSSNPIQAMNRRLDRYGVTWEGLLP